MSQEDLENSARLGKGLINRYENGKGDPSTEVVVKLSGVLEVSADWLLGLVNEPLGKIDFSDLSASERRLITAYRSREIQEMLRIISNTRDEP